MPTNRSRATVDPDQKDLSKAVQRHQDSDRDLAPSEDSDDMAPAEKNALSWLEKNKGVSARMSRFQRNLQRQFDQQNANTQAEMQRMRRENDGMKKALARTHEQGVLADEATHQREMDGLQKQLEAAHEKGESAEVARLSRVMATKEAAFINAKTQALLGTPAREEHEAEPVNAQPQGRRATAEGRKFTQANAEWWNDPESLPARTFANGLHEKMVGEGSDPESPEHYEEIAAEVQRLFPDLEVAGVKKRRAKGAEEDATDEEEEEEDEEEAVRPARRAAVQSFQDRGQPPRGSHRRGVDLTQDDYATMRSVGMNPDNDKHLAEFARSKRETETQMRAAR